MRPRLLSFLLLGLAVLPAMTTAALAAGSKSDPNPDPERIINRSKNFLKEREPDLTAEEDAIYEKATQIIDAKPAAALTLLEGFAAKRDSKEPASPAFDLLLGNVYYATGQLDKAEAAYLRAVDRYPSFLRAWTNLGVLHYAQRQYAKAVPCLVKAVALGDRESTTFGMMALCREETGDAVGAELAFIQALAGDPGNVSWMEGLVRVFLQAKQYSRAEVMVRNLIKERPTETRYWLDYANIMVGDGRKLEAIALLEQALATGVAGHDELLELAGLYAEQDLIPEAVRTYEKVKYTPQALGERNSMRLVRVLMACSEWQKAQALLDEVGRLGVEGREAFLQIQADLLAAQKQWGAARKVLDELLQLNPMDGNALVSLGRAHLAEGDEVHAILAFEAAVQTKEGAHQASLALANIELKHRHYDRSVSHLEKALGIEKDDDVEEILIRVRSLVPKSNRPT